MLLLAFPAAALGVSVFLCVTGAYGGTSLVLHFLLFWFVSCLGLFLAYLLLLWVYSLFGSRESAGTYRPFPRFLLNQTVRMILFFTRTIPRPEGLAMLPADGTFLLVGNHLCALDPVVTLSVIRDRPLSFISKPENFRLPIVGGLMRKCGFLPIDRDNDKRALKTILAAAARMKKGTFCFGLYPEGTRSRTGELLPFRNGCFKAAQRAGVPLVVFAVAHTDEIRKNFPLRRTVCPARVCGVIPAETVSVLSTKELGDMVREMLEKNLAEMK